MMITGGATGLGLAIATAAVDAGYRVGLFDVDHAVADAAASLEGASAHVGSVADESVDVVAFFILRGESDDPGASDTI